MGENNKSQPLQKLGGNWVKKCSLCTKLCTFASLSQLFVFIGNKLFDNKTTVNSAVHFSKTSCLFTKQIR